jgi:hypothetical protein
MKQIETIMTAVALLSVEPTDRALTGWQPFGPWLDKPMNRKNPVELLEYLADAGST